MQATSTSCPTPSPRSATSSSSCPSSAIGCSCCSSSRTSCPTVPERYDGHPDLFERVEECQSPVYIFVEVDEDGIVRMYATAPKEAPTTRGFASILAQGLAGLTVDEVLAVPDDFPAGHRAHRGGQSAAHPRNDGAARPHQAPDPPKDRGVIVTRLHPGVREEYRPRLARGPGPRRRAVPRPQTRMAADQPRREYQWERLRRRRDVGRPQQPRRPEDPRYHPAGQRRGARRGGKRASRGVPAPPYRPAGRAQRERRSHRSRHPAWDTGGPGTRVLHSGRTRPRPGNAAWRHRGGRRASG